MGFLIFSWTEDTEPCDLAQVIIKTGDRTTLETPDFGHFQTDASRPQVHPM